MRGCIEVQDDYGNLGSLKEIRPNKARRQGIDCTENTQLISAPLHNGESSAQ